MIITLPDTTSFDDELIRYAQLLEIPNFRCVSMRIPHTVESGILNLADHKQTGTHWTCWYKNGERRCYFDSFAEPPPLEILKYLKSSEELKQNTPVIHRNAVQF